MQDDSEMTSSTVGGLSRAAAAGRQAQSAQTKRGFYSGRVGYFRHLAVRGSYLVADIVLFIPLLLLTIASRFIARPVDVGLGPTPTINSRYHKRALESRGYRCETFVYHTWYFTNEFDVMLNKICPRALGPYLSYVFCLFRYKSLYVYFSGGPLGFTTLLARCEPFLFQLAGIKTVVMPFGADVQVLSRATNKLFVHGSAQDYPGNRLTVRRTAALVDVWTQGASHVVSGCDWVDYMYFWDTLMLAHFAIDTDAFEVSHVEGRGDRTCSPLRIVHAPNHRALKGTAHILRAVEELRAEGVAIELSILEGLPNHEVHARIKASDVVVDQLVIGWYAMFALEGMAQGKPVVCRIRKDLRELYEGVGLIAPGELPVVDADIRTIKDVLKRLASMSRGELRALGEQSRAFVERHHSIGAIGAVFDRINRNIGVQPRK